MKTSIPRGRPAALKQPPSHSSHFFKNNGFRAGHAYDFPAWKPSVSTINGQNGDLNFMASLAVPKTVIASAGLKAGDILVSNFNNSSNLQGFGQ